MTTQIRPQITPIDQAGIARAPVPYFVHFEPAAAVAAGAIVTVTFTLGAGRNFVCTHIGQTTNSVVFPGPGGQDFKINIEDVTLSQRFAPQRFLMRAITGVNPASSDSPAFELPKPWKFFAQDSITVEFENIGTMNCLPYLVLAGYLD